jgi:hypothetical protein
MISFSVSSSRSPVGSSAKRRLVQHAGQRDVAETDSHSDACADSNGCSLAESELGVLTSQCLDRRIPNKQILIDEIAAWEHDHNANHTKANWQFTTKNARIKLKHLYRAI